MVFPSPMEVLKIFLSPFIIYHKNNHIGPVAYYKRIRVHPYQCIQNIPGCI